MRRDLLDAGAATLADLLIAAAFVAVLAAIVLGVL